MTWPSTRTSEHETEIYDEDAGEWIAADGSGGSHYQTQLVVIGQDDTGQGVIYYGAT